MAANCTNVELGGPSLEGLRENFHFRYFTGDVDTDTQPGHLDYEDTFGMCVDTFGGYETFAKCDILYMHGCSGERDPNRRSFVVVCELQHSQQTIKMQRLKFCV
jgi:hypothetical protein